MKRLIILTDDSQQFLISKANFRFFTSMDITKIEEYFIQEAYEVVTLKFSELDLSKEYKDVYVLYQTSEAPGAFYKRYIEDLVYFLERKGAVMLPCYPLFKAHHNKVFMELMRAGFSDPELQTIKSICYGSWTDARNYDSGFPVVIKQSSNSGGAGVFLAKNKKEYDRKVKRAGGVLIANTLPELVTYYIKRSVKKIILKIYPEKSKEIVKYDVRPVSTSLVVQNFIPGLSGDYKVLFFGGKYFMMYRKNRKNDFRASGSGQFFPVPDQDHEGILNFARKLTDEIDFPVIGMDIGFDGSNYHMIEFQVVHIGTSALHRSYYWHEFHDGRWIRYDGLSDLEAEFARAVCSFIEHEKRK